MKLRCYNKTHSDQPYPVTPKIDSTTGCKSRIDVKFDNGQEGFILIEKDDNEQVEVNVEYTLDTIKLVYTFRKG